MSERGVNVVRELDAYAVRPALGASGHLPEFGEALFVINLCAAMTPIGTDSKTLSGFEQFKLYQVSRMEDGRRRYRLRLGFFTSEAAAEDALVAIRSRYATAFATCLCNEDLKHASGYLKRPLQELQQEFDLQRTGRFKVLPRTAQEPAAAGKDRKSSSSTLPSTVAPSGQPATAKPASGTTRLSHAESDGDEIEINLIPASTQKDRHGERKPINSKAVELTAETPPATAPVKRSSNGTAPFHVGAGMNIPDVGLSLAQESRSHKADTPQQAVANFAAKHAGAAKPASVTPPPVAKHVDTVSADAPAQKPPKPVAGAAPKPGQSGGGWRQQEADDGIPTLDTTQTIRALTKKELEDANASKWFVVQLAISDQPVNLDAMPRLDIFEAYSLYSVAVMENGGIRHALRLGFFSEQVSAEAVMGYLRTFFGTPTIERISCAEQERFSVTKPAPAEEQAKSQARVITLEEKRPTPIKLPVTPVPASSPASRLPAKSNGTKSNGTSSSDFKPMVTTRVTGKYAAPAVRYNSSTNAPMKKRAPNAAATTSNLQRDLLDEAKSLGLSDTQILRVKKNPSLLSRLVGKLTK